MKVKEIIGVCEISPITKVKIVGYDKYINDYVLAKGTSFMDRDIKKYYENELEAINVKDDYLIIYIDEVVEDE